MIQTVRKALAATRPRPPPSVGHDPQQPPHPTHARTLTLADRRGLAEQLGVKMNDILVRVNNTSVHKLPFKDVIEKVKSETYPIRLTMAQVKMSPNLSGPPQSNPVDPAAGARKRQRVSESQSDGEGRSPTSPTSPHRRVRCSTRLPH